jgi:hypothetical protein
MAQKGLNDLDADVNIRGALSVAGAVTVPASSFGDREADASDPITATKLQHQWQRLFAQDHGSAAVAERRVIHLARGAGTVVAVRAGSVVACVGGATITVDVKKNGTTILSASIVLDSANTAYIPEAGTVSVGTYAADDVFEVVVTVAAGGGTIGQGLFVDVCFREAA